MTAIACPSCGAEMSLDVALTHEELRAAVYELMVMSLPLGALVMQYVTLFKPAKNRLSPIRMTKLVKELLPSMQAGNLQHKGRLWAMPVESWKLGLEAMLAKAQAGKVQLPLDNHNYLFAVLVGMADGREAREEQASETARRSRANVAGTTSLAEVAAGMRDLAKDMNDFADRRPPAPPAGTSPFVRAARAEAEARRQARKDGQE